MDLIFDRRQELWVINGPQRIVIGRRVPLCMLATLPFMTLCSESLILLYAAGLTVHRWGRDRKTSFEKSSRIAPFSQLKLRSELIYALYSQSLYSLVYEIKSCYVISLYSFCMQIKYRAFSRSPRLTNSKAILIACQLSWWSLVLPALQVYIRGSPDYIYFSSGNPFYSGNLLECYHLIS